MHSTNQKNCRVAFIGSGKMAEEHARAFRDLEGVSLSGVYSRTPERARQMATKAGIPIVCGSIGELYEKTQADLVVIAVSEESTASVAHDCFNYPWKVLMEKPPGIDVKEATDLLQSVTEKKRDVFVALNRRHYSSTRFVQRELLEHTGRRFLRVLDQQSQPLAQRLGFPKEIIEKWMYANSIHLIDYIRLWGRGRLCKVEPIRKWNAANPDCVMAYLSFESGDEVLYESLWNGPGPWSVDVHTPTKWWRLAPLERVQFQNEGERSLNYVNLDPIDQKYKPGFYRQAETAIAACRSESFELPTLREAVETMRIIESIYFPDLSLKP